jgi:hypothetical protein
VFVEDSAAGLCEVPSAVATMFPTVRPSSAADGAAVPEWGTDISLPTFESEFQPPIIIQFFEEFRIL